MKKIVLSLGVLALTATAAFAQSKGAATPTVAAADAANQTAESMKFDSEIHDFGTIPEGPSAEHKFVFTNTGKEPIIIQRAQASCGCTTPSYSKDPILPGQKGTLVAAYGTQGRPNAFTKTITVYTNVGTKVLTIKGNVEKAPTSSVPQNSSLIKTN